MKHFATLLLALVASVNADPLWQQLGSGIAWAPTTLTAPTTQTRRVLLNVDGVVALFEYDCTDRTAAMLYVMRPDREPYAPANNQPRTYRPDSAHGVITRTVCGRGMV